MKVVKKHIKKAILIYEDPDLKTGRRVALGDPLVLVNLIIIEFPILWKHIQALLGKNLSPEEMLKAYKEIKEDWVKTHEVKFSENMEMELSYEVKEINKGGE